LRHGAVKQAVAVGMADDRLVEVAAVFLELKTGKSVTEEEIMNYCRQHLASFKIPRRVIFVNDWPITGAGEIRRFVLKGIPRARSDAWIAGWRRFSSAGRELFSR